MFNLNSKTKIYIVSPYYNTGGPKSLHQLANKLIHLGYDVFMVYGNHSKISKVDKVLFNDCLAKVSFEVIDDSKNLLICSEYDTGWLLRYKKIQKCIWWLSLDYYLINNPWKMAKHKIDEKNWSKFLLLPIFLKHVNRHIIHGIYGFYYYPAFLKRVYHLYNCQYVKNYLLQKKVSSKNIHYLCGPIELEKKDISKLDLRKIKKNVICYNPAKMDLNLFNKVMAKVCEVRKDVAFEKIAGLKHSDVLNVLLKSKVYIDLGYFPGPERMPREAVTMYCNILTANRGSAQNNIDVPIDSQYKFKVSRDNVSSIANKLIDMLNNYFSEVKNFDGYRKKVYLQRKLFNTDIENIFGGNNEYSKK